MALGAQEPVPDTSKVVVVPAVAPAVAPVVVPGVGLRMQIFGERLRFSDEHPAFSPFGRFAPVRRQASEVADNRAFGMRQALETRLTALWGTTAASAFSEIADTTRIPALVAFDSSLIRPDSSVRSDIFGDYADLGLQLQSRLEAKGERSRKERCTNSQLFNPGANCKGSFQPTFDFQFNVKTGGVVADRVHVNVDYDSEREFDASNNISVYYEGKTDELIERLEVGNVSFAPPSSRFITSGIPSGNYGLQAIGQLGPMRFRTIMAQQKGNVVKDNVFTVGDRTLQSVETEIEDYKVEPRRFFFTIDPVKWFGSAYPNIDILNTQQMTQLASSLPDSVRPTRVFVYRLQFNSLPQNPNGPQFLINGRPEFQRGPIYEYLREGVDYYIDPSQLWISLVRPASLNGERYVIAYNIGNGQSNPGTGGDPVLQNVTQDIFANLIWDPSITPDDSAFTREIRSVYRLGGDDIVRQSVTARIVTGNGQEKPAAGGAQSYLQMFGLAQISNPSSFDVENRLWPRPSDPNVNTSAGGSGSRIIRDYFVVFPSLQPFSQRGLVQPGNPSNDTIYRTPGEYLYSSQHPQSLYTLRLRYSAEGGGDAGSLALGSVQVRQNSERITIEGRQLKRGTDYTVDYDLGRVTFTRPDTLFPQARQVSVQYEENPLFAASPTSIFGIATQFPLTNGQVSFTAISQSQKTTFNRPPLGFEPASSLVAGVSGAFQFDASMLTRAIEKLPFIESSAPSTISITGEMATSRPRPNAAGQAYVESFEGEGGIQIPLGEGGWYLSSQPVEGSQVAPLLGPNPFALEKASTLVWQNIGAFKDGTYTTTSFERIDPLVRNRGRSFGNAPEPMLWLSLYPLKFGGQRSNAKDTFQWQLPGLSGPRWRSLRTSLSTTGVDLSRVETLEFWTLVDTSIAGRGANAVLIFDLGDISENSIVFAPESLFVRTSTNPAYPSVPDSIFTGKQFVGKDTLDSERDPLFRNFDVAKDDIGLPGDRVDRIVVVDSTRNGLVRDTPLALCRSNIGRPELLGDARANCTIGNSRLDEEDLDLDGQLNLVDPTAERVFRFVVDLRNPRSFSRLGVCSDTAAASTARNNCWVFVRIPFRAPTDTIGSPVIRRIKSLRVTMASGTAVSDSTIQFVPVVRLKLVGSPWIKRSDRVLRGIGGESASNGYTIASIIGTNDYDASRGIFYESPPGVTDEADSKSSGFETGQVQINERSLRLLAGELDTNQRAEAYYRFPDAQKSFMGYKEMRLWARGRNNGWGLNGELDFYVKIGRDANNFYMYRTPANSGDTKAAWQPEIRVRFQNFLDLRARLQNTFLQGSGKRIDCTGTDSVLIASIPVPASDTLRYAACDGEGYMIYTLDPNISPPNLAAVQELSVGMVRSRPATAATANPIMPGDTLELWVDDIRLTDVEDTPGYAGQFGVQIAASDIADIRMNMSRKDPHFRQLAEQPSFVTDNAFDIGSSVRLDKLMPQRLGFALPFSVNLTSSGSDPLYVSRTDVQGAGIVGLRTPKVTATSYTIGLYRQTPLQNKWVGPIVNNLRLNGSYASANSRTEYSDGTSKNSVVNADYQVASTGTPRRLPQWFERGIQLLPDWLAASEPIRALRGAQYRVSPASFRISSGMQRSTSNNQSFQKPAESSTDSPTSSRGLSHVWRNGSALELRPFSALSARWDITSLRDMRHYDDRTSVGLIAETERQRFLGLDVGLERERNMSTSFSFTPSISAWIKPRADLSASYTMSRDPNSQSLLQTRDSVGAYRLPRRLRNSQTLNLGAGVDFARAIVLYTSDSNFMRRVADRVQVVELSWSRSLISAFDGTPFTPPLSYQFALGGSDDFTQIGDRRAASAGLTNSFGASNGIALPLGLRLSNRYQRNDTRNWTRRVNNTLGVTDAQSVNFPDAAVQWTYRPPQKLQRFVSSVGGQVATRKTTARTFTPPEGASPAQRSFSESRSLPVNGSVTWGFGGGFSTTAGYSTSERRDELADRSLRLGTSREFSTDVGKQLTPPSSWSLKQPIRTHLGFSRSRSASFIFNNSSAEAGTRRSRLSDNGRHTVTLNMDTEVAENLSFSLTGSRSVNFDETFNRRFTQMVVTAVFNLGFFAGELR